MIPEPAYKLTWNGKDVSADMSQYLLSLTFEDREEGESDSLSFVVDDKDGKWRNEFYPRKGDPVELEIGWSGGEFTYCGEFQIDQIEVYRGVSGSRVTISALSALITAPARTKRCRRYEKITLKRLANSIASDLGMTATGIIDNITLSGISMHKETSLAFLRRVAERYGYIFTIKKKKIIFSKKTNLQENKPIAQFDAGEAFISCTITDATDLDYKEAQHTYWDAKKKKKVSYNHKGKTSTAKDDILHIGGHVADPKQSEEAAKAAWLKANNGSVSAKLEFAYGATNILAGNNIELTRMGKLSGLYHISNTTHQVAPGTGARLSADAFKVGEIDSSLY